MCQDHDTVITPKLHLFSISSLLQKAAKRDPGLEKEAQTWMQAVVGEPFPAGSYEDALKDGVYLCKSVHMLYVYIYRLQSPHVHKKQTAQNLCKSDHVIQSDPHRSRNRTSSVYLRPSALKLKFGMRNL